MNRRPLSLTVIGWLFIVVGLAAVVHHGSEFKPGRLPEQDLLWACAVSLVAACAGVFLLRRCNWARWVLALWMTFHIVLSFFHNLTEVAVHIFLFSILGYFLFRPHASAWLRTPPAGFQGAEMTSQDPTPKP